MVDKPRRLLHRWEAGKSLRIPVQAAQLVKIGFAGVLLMLTQQLDKGVDVIPDGHIGDDKLLVVVVDDSAGRLNGKQHRTRPHKRLIICGVLPWNISLDFRHQLSFAAGPFQIRSHQWVKIGHVVLPPLNDFAYPGRWPLPVYHVCAVYARQRWRCRGEI